MSRFDSIVVGQDLVSDHYLTADFDTRLRAVRKQWAELESYEKHTPTNGSARRWAPRSRPIWPGCGRPDPATAPGVTHCSTSTPG